MPLAVALVLAIGLTPTLARVGLAIGLVDRPSADGLKIHPRPVPLTGGVGIVIGMLLGLVATGHEPDPWVGAAVVLLLALGVVDDAVTLPPIVRLLSQLAIGVLLAVGGVDFRALGSIGPAVVVLAVPVMANAVNLMDGQDGLAAGSAALSAAGLFLIVATYGPTDVLGLALIGALLGFLVWNRPPARVFMGDGGAYAVGGILVVLAADASKGYEGLLGALICLSIFAFELISTVVRRAMKGSRPLSGDRQHIYDLLARRLASRSRATLVMLVAGLVVAAVGSAAARVPLPAAIGVTIAVGSAGSLAIVALWKGTAAELRRSR